MIDLNTRMVVGWALSDRMTADIVAGVPGRAWQRGHVAESAIFHSDRGARHTSRALAVRAREHGARLSCGHTGSCHDNAVAEPFFATPRNETCYRRSFATRGEAKIAVIDFVEAYHDRRRPRSTIGYQVPAEVTDAFFGRTRPTKESALLAAWNHVFSCPKS